MSEFALAERPAVEELVRLGYGYLPPPQKEWKAIVRSIPKESLRPGDNATARDGLNRALLRDELLAAVRRLNGVSEATARRIYSDLLGLADNEEWTDRLRGELSGRVEGEAKSKTLRLVDFANPANNTFTVTNQLHVRAERSRRPDVVVFVNGIPLVVVEAKTPLAGGKAREAFDQVRQYETDVPRLFHPNLFNLVTDGHTTLYGATGAPSEHWSRWKDPWPREAAEFESPLARDLWCLLAPERLLEILAHFVVFERRDEKVTKKVCRYQQFRAAGKIARRLADGEHRRGLVWHTQGSGKSLTMVMAAMKLKFHRTTPEEELGEAPGNPSFLVLTDRVDLDAQITGTFQACGFENARQVKSTAELREAVRRDTPGLMLLSTIHKLADSRTPVPNDRDWILLVDEAHRSQEASLGAFLDATFPEAFRFGFTGTPIKTSDRDTYRHFGVPGETYLDRYSIDDALTDGATVPILYKNRRTRWEIDPKRIDQHFDQWFDDAPEEWTAEVKRRGVQMSDLVKHPERLADVAFDIWTHYRTHVLPDGFKAQVVGTDRQAVVLLKRALDRVIAEHCELHEGMDPEAARAAAEAASACVISSDQEDAKPSEDPWVADLRRELVRWSLTPGEEVEVREAFGKRGERPYFLVVCNKLLTGFDQPLEQAMYLDSPLREHNLLQAIARTNRPSPPKKHGLVVDYIGVTRRLAEAFESYRREDVENALHDLAVLEAELEAAHRALAPELGEIDRGGGDLHAEYRALRRRLVGPAGQPEDLAAWHDFRGRARAFLRVFEALAPDRAVLPYQPDFKWVGGFLAWARVYIDKKEGGFDLRAYSAKVRELLHEHVHTTGLETLVKLREITDPAFARDFDTVGVDEEELSCAAARKAAELAAELSDAEATNPLRYGRFSERIREIIRQLDQAHVNSREALAAMETLARDYRAERERHRESGLSEKEFGVLTILEELARQDEVAEPRPTGEPGTYGPAGGAPGEGGEESEAGDRLTRVAREIDALYRSDETAPPGWQIKEGQKRRLRQRVRRLALGVPGIDLREVAARVQAFALVHYPKPL